MNILGISCYYHDSSASIIQNNKIVAAVHEERFTRIKHDSSFPKNSIYYCLKEANISFDKIDFIIFYEKPFLKFERLLDTYFNFAPKGFIQFLVAMPLWIKEKLFTKNLITKDLSSFFGKFSKNKLKFSEHHLSHAASVFYTSPFETSVVLVTDGVGERSCTSVFFGNNNQLEKIKEINFPHSLGLLYSAFTQFIGFKVNSGEYKLMGLAPYGKPVYEKLIFEKLVNLFDDGSYQLNQKFFNYAIGLTMINKNFERLFNCSIRREGEPINQTHKNIAASIQIVIEKILLQILKNLRSEFQTDNLCLSGGVALNCVANSKLLQSKYFKNIWVQPACGDAGGSLGAALVYNHIALSNERYSYDSSQLINNALLGPSFEAKEIEQSLKKQNIKFYKMEYRELLNNVSEHLMQDKAVGWFQGRMEFGPRALGARSILASPKNPEMQKILNLKIKFRESFRPFAPIILRNQLDNWFDIKIDNPYMLFVAHLNKNLQQSNTIPSVIHVDNSARYQTIDQNNGKIYDLLDTFFKKTGIPILINTSFNIRGEPIVCSPDDAIKCFLGTGLDLLVIENYIAFKEEQMGELLISDYKSNFSLD